MQGSEGVEKVLKIDRPVGRRVLKFDGPSGRGLWMAASRQFLGPLLWKKVAPQATEDRDVSSLLIFGVPQGFAQFRPEEGACVTGFTFMSPVPARRRAKAKNDQLGCGKSDVYRLSSIVYLLPSIAFPNVLFLPVQYPQQFRTYKAFFFRLIPKSSYELAAEKEVVILRFPAGFA